MLDTSDHIFAYLEQKTLTMNGANIPDSPNGLNANVYFGAATQCYNSTVITVMAQNFNVTAQLGTWTSLDGGAPAVGMVGHCDQNTISGPFMATSTAVAFSSVQGNGDCFDIDVTYNSYAQEGRGKFVNNGQEIDLELYFKNKVTGDRCADGMVGAATVQSVVTLPDAGTMNYPFTGNAVQKYVISQ